MTFPNLQISQEHEDIKVEAANEIEESIDSVTQAGAINNGQAFILVCHGESKPV